MAIEIVGVVGRELGEALQARARYANQWRVSLMDSSRIRRRLESPDITVPTRLVLEVRALREDALLTAYQLATSMGVSTILIAQLEARQLTRMLRLLSLGGAECLLELEGFGARNLDAALTSIDVSIRSRVLWSLSTRLARLGPSALEASVLRLLRPEALASPEPRVLPPTRTMARQLATIGVQSFGRLHRVGRLSLSMEIARTSSLTRPDLASSAGFGSKRTLASVAKSVLGMSLRESADAMDDAFVASRLAAYCVRD